MLTQEGVPVDTPSRCLLCLPYVLSYVPTVATDDVLSLADDEVRHEIQYYDHFGNPTAKVQHGFSPLGHDLITLQDYDALNRASKLWLPVAYGSSDGSYVNPGKLSQTARSFFLYGMDSHPYSLTVYDGSALNEVVEEYGPGKNWHTTVTFASYFLRWLLIV